MFSKETVKKIFLSALGENTETDSMSVAHEMFSGITEDVKNASKDAISDTFHEIIVGKRTIEDWADSAVKGVDEIKDKVVSEENKIFVGGYLDFAMSKKNNKKVVISFELYFLDEDKQWEKMTAESDVYATTFTADALEELRSKDKIRFEVQ